MTYIILFLLELLVLWFVSRRLTSRLISNIPVWLYAILFLPGTVIHELSHFLAAKILSVPVGKFSLSFKKYNDEVVLGSVSIAKVDIFRRFLVGIAPLIFGITLLMITIYMTVKNNIYSNWLAALVVGYVIFIIANSMFSSRQDLKGAWKLGIIVIFIAVASYALGIKISFSFDNSDFLKNLSLYLLAPIVIDVLMLIFLNYGRPRNTADSD